MSYHVSEASGHLPFEDDKTIVTIKYQVDDGVRYSSKHAWDRGYTTNNKVVQIPITYPLNDLRKLYSGERIKSEEHERLGWSWSHSAEILKKFGFTAVKFDPRWTEVDAESQAEDCDDLETLEQTYYPEVKKAVQKLTGASRVFITNSIVRRGGEVPAKDSNGPQVRACGKKKSSPVDYQATDETRPTHLASSDNLKPARGAHVDYTSLGARRSIRRWRPDIYAAAVEAGVIEAEEKICAAAQVNAEDKESNGIIDQEYNKDGKLGPRYAAYSVWRPMRTVQRDPLAMAPRSSFPTGTALGYLGYESRMLAAPSMGGDFLRELEAVSVTEEVAKAYEESNGKVRASELDSPQWYYLPEQKSDEVIVLKFFDSAALTGGGGSGEAGGAPHASPDLGESSSGPARWSIEVRCIAFW
ncbi:GA4 desaturase [Glarea lozoyensis ATCC 20868]|uniref:GA4 desaturase n=1 Tax=Glarea lozoyensis (strain ATCC 20868 / MF5171) TaxID=1116229 RepID=S3D8V0_GLAL2|nr:GA4 desaturase [Glarea lozoyensis ATCC 20868]EPE28426.1 GA4 desaturase [Glarea lozoyensis ATCC 20868]